MRNSEEISFFILWGERKEKAEGENGRFWRSILVLAEVLDLRLAGEVVMARNG